MQNMGRIIKPTGDGSFTIFDEQVGECFHSIHGAVQESQHVFIRSGFDWCQKASVRVFEVGFGSGLNAYLTLIRANETQKRVDYEAIELFPISPDLVKTFAHGIEDIAVFERMHDLPWQVKVPVTPDFYLTKRQENILEAKILGPFDIVYFDAFSPEKQPELWTEDLFARIFDIMDEPSALVTYCAKGEIKRRLRRVGFRVESLPGPPGKREITRAIKPAK
jgi:tRNA U34 5-methylaminomethyl-2-thiouridine-forming methyltransferase MnmC